MTLGRDFVRTTNLRHSLSSRKIRIVFQITSSAVRKILKACGVLEVMDTSHSIIDLFDTVTTPEQAAR